jgi:HEAT repeat protein
VPVLAAALKQKETSASASQTLIDLQGAGVAEALLKQAEAGDPAIRSSLLTVLAERRQTDALPLVRKSVNDDDAKVRRAALKSLAALGTQPDLAMLAELVVTRKDDAERDQTAQALSDLGARMTDKAARCEPVLQAFAKAEGSAKVSLLTVLSTLGGDKALASVRGALTGEGELRKAAVRALAEWPDAAPMADLLAVAKDDKEKSSQILALRGYIRMVGISGARSQDRAKSYSEALALATRPEEKKLAVTGLADVAHADALKMVETFLEDAALQREAFVAYEKIAESLVSKQPALAKEALQRVTDKAADAGLRSKAKKALDKIK